MRDVMNHLIIQLCPAVCYFPTLNPKF